MFKLLGDVIWLWHKRNFLHLRRSIVLVLAAAVVFILPGMFLGGINETFKGAWLSIGIAISLGVALYLAACRVPIGAEIAVLLRRYRRGNGSEGLVATVVEGAADYVQAVAAFAASLGVVGLLAMYFPAHNDPKKALAAIFAVLVLIFFAVWKGGGSWWPTFVWGVAVVTLIWALVGVILPKVPQYAERLMADAGAAVDCMFGGECPPPRPVQPPQKCTGDECYTVALEPAKLTAPIKVRTCYTLNVFPALGGRAEGVFADDPAKKSYHFPYYGPNPEFGGPLHLRGEGLAEVVFTKSCKPW